jgi:hypothetical protein
VVAERGGAGYPALAATTKSHSTCRYCHTVAVKEAHVDPARWYSADRARVMPTTLIIKARKPFHAAGATQQRDRAVGS